VFVTGQHSPAIESLRIPVGQGLTGWVAEASRSILNGNPSVEPGWSQTLPFRSALAIPLETSQGLVGVLTLYSGSENGFRSEDLTYLCRIGPALSLCIDRNAHPAIASSLTALDRAVVHVT
jgi:GAF domain-containing protein